MTPLEFRDPTRARELRQALARVVSEIGRSPVAVMHVCGSHEQAIARSGISSDQSSKIEFMIFSSGPEQKPVTAIGHGALTTEPTGPRSTLTAR